MYPFQGFVNYMIRNHFPTFKWTSNLGVTNRVIGKIDMGRSIHKNYLDQVYPDFLAVLNAANNVNLLRKVKNEATRTTSVTLL